MSAILDKLKLKKLESQKQFVKEKFCEEQQCDLVQITEKVDDLIATAVACGSSSQNYSELERLKKDFLNYLVDMSEKYRIVHEPKY